MGRFVGLLCAVIWWVPGLASAHGRFPETHGVTFHPSEPDTLVAAATFGPVKSTDGGRTWRWSCSEAHGAATLEDPTYQLMADGSLIVSGFNGLRRSEPDLCEFTVPAGDVFVGIQDVRRSVDTPSTAFALLNLGGGVDNLVFRSDDAGLTWAPTSAGIEPIFFQSMRVTAGGRLYLSGVYAVDAEHPEREAFVHRSFDEGATWERFAFAPFGPGDYSVDLLGVDPNDPERLFARIRLEAEVDGDEKLARSLDGGQTWEVVATHRRIGGLAIAPDGRIFVGAQWVAMAGDPTMPVVAYPHGLHRSDDGGATFSLVRDDLDVGCLAWHQDSLWICADEFRDGFMLGESTDGGVTVEPRLELRSIAGPTECAADSQVAVDCALAYPDFERDYPVDPEEEGGGCSCRAAGRPGAGSGALGTLLLGALALTFGRRRI